MTDARPPAAPHKKSDLLPVRSYHVSEHILGGVIELFVSVSTRQKHRQFKLLGTTCCVCFQHSDSPKLLFNVSLPLLNNETLQWSCEWEIRQHQTVWVTCLQLHTYYRLHRLFFLYPSHIKLNQSLTLVYRHHFSTPSICPLLLLSFTSF